MKTERVSLRLSERSVNDKIEFSRNLQNAMNGNSQFANPSPTLAAIKTATDNLETAALAAADGAKSKIAFMHQQEALLDNLLQQLGNWVDSLAKAAAAAGGDAQALILAAGMDFRRSANKAPLPFAPSGLNVVSVREGEADLKWKTVKYARSYVIEISNDVSAIQNGNPNPVTSTVPTLVANARVFITWNFGDVTTKTKFTILGLSSGTKYAFRVYAVGSAGKGNPSVPVVIKVF